MSNHSGPQALVEYVLHSADDKVSKPFTKLILQGILAGIYIAIGAIGYLKLVATTADPGVGAFLGALVFPVGIIAIILMQTELYTSGTMSLIAIYARQNKITSILRVLVTILCSNLVGGITIAYLANASGIFNEKVMELIIEKTVHKVHMPFDQLFFSSILCNIIVCTGVCLAYACKDEISKIVSLWLAITVFVLTGTEHVVANMYYLFAGFFGGADVTIMDIAYNLSVAALGNLIGGGIIVSGFNFLVARKDLKKAI
jgi:formate/nitrite transporter